MVESGVYGDFLRGVFEYQAHFQNLFKKIKLKLFKIKIEYFLKVGDLFGRSRFFDQVNFLRSNSNSNSRLTFLTFANNF